MYQQAIAHLMSDDHSTSVLGYDFAAFSESADTSTSVADRLEGRGGYHDAVTISREGSVELSSGASDALSDGENGGTEASGVSSFSDVMTSRSRSELFSKISLRGEAAETVSSCRGWGTGLCVMRQAWCRVPS